ncbi:MAG TPA: FecR domain-containing protein, partial [Anseongella sp.]|nr:FecR domain-containing protein [Anseongella sp.]
MNYENFSGPDFMTDEYFIRWVKSPDEGSERFWKEWLAAHPLKKGTVEKAREAVLLLSGMEVASLSDARIGAMKENIDSRTENSSGLKIVRLKKEQVGIPGRTRGAGKRLYRYAAILGGVILLSASVQLFLEISGRPARHLTAYGETKTLTLPDGSKVILNANSEIKYAKDWSGSGDREVWLSGEAFFAVERTATSRKFRVCTGDLKVEVLGTKFNVTSRKGHARVVLSSGRIKLSVPLAGDTADLLMKPGELVEYTRKDRQIIRDTVNAEHYISWINDEWVL